MYHQILGTPMRTNCDSSCACLTIGYKEQEILFKEQPANYFSFEEINIIKKILKRYMIDGFLFLTFDNFVSVLITFTHE